MGRLKTAEGPVDHAAPQIAGREEPFRSEIRESLKGRTQALEDLAVELLARGLSVRDIEDAFRDESGRLLLSRTVRRASSRWSRPTSRDRRVNAASPIASCIAHLRMPITHRRTIRTTNLLERLFVEERRRLKIIPNAFGEKAVLKLMFGAMIRAAERWRAIRVSELERRQMRAVREELDHEYEAQNGLGTKASAPAHPAQSSSTSRT